MDPQSPEEVRNLILTQHQMLRKELGLLETKALETLSEGRGDSRELLEDLGSLIHRLEEHMALEEANLTPTLREIDAWGPERVELFQDEHRRQCQVLRSLTDDSGTASDDTRALLVLGFVRWLRVDMDREESVFLSKELLRDDPTYLPEAE